MTFFSFAQNFEDVILWRALKSVENGFYIDVGANDPHEHSVTKAFYDRGWRGVNVEPMASYVERLTEARPRDITLQAVATNFIGEMTFYEVADTGLSTTEAEVAEVHTQAGRPVVEVKIAATTLAEICRQHADGDVHFLKVDVEGGTLAVLEGMDFAAVRPWIVVVEATKPMTQLVDFEGWEGLLLEANYLFAYADGLNRFYVAAERPELLDAFRYPPNVFDEFLVATGLDVTDVVTAAASRAETAEKWAQQVNESLLQAQAQAAAAEKRADTLPAYAAEAVKQLGEMQARVAEADRRVEELQAAADAAAAEAALLRDAVRHLKRSVPRQISKALSNSFRPIRHRLRALFGTKTQTAASRFDEARPPWRPPTFQRMGQIVSKNFRAQKRRLRAWWVKVGPTWRPPTFQRMGQIVSKNFRAQKRRFRAWRVKKFGARPGPVDVASTISVAPVPAPHIVPTDTAGEAEMRRLAGEMEHLMLTLAMEAAAAPRIEPNYRTEGSAPRPPVTSREQGGPLPPMPPENV